jgi:ribosomal protein L11 methyltransferase
VQIRDHHADAVAAIMEADGALAVSMEPDGHEELLDPYPPKQVLWRSLVVHGLYPVSIDLVPTVAALNEYTESQVSLARVDDRDWVQAVNAGFKPIQVGDRLWVCPTRCTPPDPGAINIRLDAGPAFGTGTHPTTRMCLDFLSRHPLTQRRVLDYGCGSGVLALAALGLGAQDAWAVDADPRALECTRANAAFNGLQDRLCASAPEKLDAAVVADVVVSNILAETLIELAAHLSRLTRPGGWLVLSGILTHQVARVAAHFPHFDFSERRSDDWVLLAAPKGNRSS